MSCLVKLTVIQILIESAFRYELLMIAHFDNISVLEYEDAEEVWP